MWETAATDTWLLERSVCIITVVLSTDLTERESTSSVTEMLSHSIILLSFLLTKRATHIKKKR